VRGASALAKLLHDHPSPSLRVLVVWEPVIASDVAPPSPALVAEFADARAELFWDPSRQVSRALLARGDRDPGFDVSRDGILWDTLLVFPAGARWDGELAPPHDHAGSDVADDLPIIAPRLP
jgi:hypothetical protein